MRWRMPTLSSLSPHHRRTEYFGKTLRVSPCNHMDAAHTCERLVPEVRLRLRRAPAKATSRLIPKFPGVFDFEAPDATRAPTVRQPHPLELSSSPLFEALPELTLAHCPWVQTKSRAHSWSLVHAVRHSPLSQTPGQARSEPSGFTTMKRPLQWGPDQAQFPVVRLQLAPSVQSVLVEQRTLQVLAPTSQA
jgi:hypothetical protein